MDVVNLERGDGNPLFEYRFLKRLRGGVRVGFEHEFDVTGSSRGHDRQPTKLANGNVFAFPESENVCVESERLGLVVDEYAAQLDSQVILPA